MGQQPPQGGYPPQGGGYPPQGGGYQQPQQQYQQPQQQYQQPQQQYQQPQPTPAGPPPDPTRSHLLLIILSLPPFGLLGFDRFYLGKIGTGIIKAATFGAFGIWTLYDMFKTLYNARTDADGAALKGQDLRDPTILLWLSASFGIMGLDRFYLGQTKLGLIKLFTLGGFFIWWLYDLYMVLTGGLTDARGLPIQEEERKYQSVALLLSIFAGQFGLDRHYLGHRSMAMLKFFTGAGMYMWYFLDIILIILNSLKDSKEQGMLQE